MPEDLAFSCRDENLQWLIGSILVGEVAFSHPTTMRQLGCGLLAAFGAIASSVEAREQDPGLALRPEVLAQRSEQDWPLQAPANLSISGSAALGDNRGDGGGLTADRCPQESVVELHESRSASM